MNFGAGDDNQLSLGPEKYDEYGANGIDDDFDGDRDETPGHNKKIEMIESDKLPKVHHQKQEI